MMTPGVDFVSRVRRIAALRSLDPAFDHHAFAAVVAELERLLEDGDEIRARRLAAGWEHELRRVPPGSFRHRGAPSRVPDSLPTTKGPTR